MSEALLNAGRQTLMLELQEASHLPERLGDDFVRAANIILHCEGKVVVSGIGKSGHIGKKIAATLASTGTPAFFVHPAEALHGDLGMIESRESLGRASRSILILCNASGEFIGISIRRNPAAYSFSPMATISSGFTPRKMATNPVFCKSVLNGMGTFPGVGGQ